MKILLLTPVDPISSGMIYKEILDHFENYKINVVSIPFFAEIHAQNNDQLYLPTLFSFWKTLKEDRKVKRTVYKGDNLLVIGNSFKEHEFDMIVSFGKEEDNDYVLYLRDSQQFKDTELQESAKKLYTWKDAELNFPTIEHIKKFLEGVYKKDE